METPIQFGTDGWRGRIADDYTFDNVRRCAQGFAHYLKDRGLASQGVVVGYDKRFQSEDFAAACAAVLAANGIKAWLTDRATPTPVISYGVVAKKAGGAINITASHNPPTDNGFKVRDPNGGAIDPDGLKEIEARIPKIDGVKSMPLAEAKAKGLVEVFDAAPDYLVHLKDLIDVQPIIDAGLNILVEPMWGNGAGWFPRLLAGGKTTVREIHNERNPIFPEMKRPEPIPPNIDTFCRWVASEQVDAGLVTDGDADRLGLVDENGQFVNQMQVYGLLAYYLLEIRGWRGPLIKSTTTTQMVDRLGELYGVPVYSVKIGFKHAAPKMIETNALMAGEESGSYAFRGLPERDGLLAGLFMLDFMARTGQKPSVLISQLFSLVGPHYFDRVDVLIAEEQREYLRRFLIEHLPNSITGLEVINVDMTDGVKFIFRNHDWLFFRFSGTEPVVRVAAEVTSESLLKPLLDAGVQMVNQYRG